MERDLRWIKKESKYGVANNIRVENVDMVEIMLELKGIEEVSKYISNFIYKDKIEETKQLMELFDKITRKELNTPDDYVEMYDNNFYTYTDWKSLVDSEKDQTDELTEKELENELKDENFGSVWKLPCGWYVQYV